MVLVFLHFHHRTHHYGVIVDSQTYHLRAIGHDSSNAACQLCFICCGQIKSPAMCFGGWDNCKRAIGPGYTGTRHGGSQLLISHLSRPVQNQSHSVTSYSPPHDSTMRCGVVSFNG